MLKGADSESAIESVLMLPGGGWRMAYDIAFGFVYFCDISFFEAVVASTADR